MDGFWVKPGRELNLDINTLLVCGRECGVYCVCVCVCVSVCMQARVSV